MVLRKKVWRWWTRRRRTLWVGLHVVIFVDLLCNALCGTAGLWWDIYMDGDGSNGVCGVET